MSENESKSGPRQRRSKRFLSPSQKYEIWLRLVRQEATVAEVATAEQVDRSTIMRIKTVAKEGALASLAVHQGVGYVTPDDEHQGRGEAIRQARREGLQQARQRRLARHRNTREDTTTPGPSDIV